MFHVKWRHKITGEMHGSNVSGPFDTQQQAEEHMRVTGGEMIEVVESDPAETIAESIPAYGSEHPAEASTEVIEPEIT